jgi:amino acid transporter
MKIWKNYNLSIVLFLLFFFSWVAQGVFQWEEYVGVQNSHNQQVESTSFIPEFMAATFENWQSEFLQLFTFVVLTTFLIHKGSHESKDSDEEMMAALTRIEKSLKTRK